MSDRLQDVFASLQKHDVKYVVIGGIAAILHGAPRTALELGILIETTPENAKRLLDALLDAHLGTAALVTPEELLAEEITVFNGRVRLDVQTSTPGIDFAEAWRARETMTFKDHPFYVVSRNHLLDSKRAAGRPVDLDDVRALEGGANGSP